MNESGFVFLNSICSSGTEDSVTISVSLVVLTGFKLRSVARVLTSINVSVCVLSLTVGKLTQWTLCQYAASC